MDPARGQTLEDERIRLVSLMARHLHNRGELDVVTIDPEIIRPWATRDASTQVNPEDLDAPIGNPNLVNRSVVEATIAAVSSSRRRLSNNDLPPVNKKIKIEPGTSYQATPSEADTEVQNDDLVWSDEDDRVNSTLAKPPNGVDVGRQSTSKPTTSMTPPTTPEFSGDSSNKSIKREPSELVTNATATPRINSTHCANVGCHERSDPSSTTNLCSNCLFWLHFKCVKKSVWEEKKSPDHDSCVFCSMMKSEFGKCDLPIINESKLRGSFLKKKAKAGAPIPGTSSSDGSQQQVAVLPAEMGGQEPGIPAFPIASWEFYWNIAYTSPQNVERNFKVGDFVYVRDEDVELTVLFKIEFLIRDANKEPWARVFEYCHPENIRKDYGRKFLTNEVMEYKLTRDNVKYARLSDIRGPPAWVVSKEDYCLFIPRGIRDSDRYIERFRFDPVKIQVEVIKATVYKTTKDSFAVIPRSVKLTTHVPIEYVEKEWVKFDKNYRYLMQM